MATRDKVIEIAVGDRRIAGTLIAPATAMPGVLFVHGWAGDQRQYLNRAREIAALGCVCLTFDLHGHAQTEPHQATVTREDNLCDLIAAYDVLAAHPLVDGTAIAAVGSSYGGYLAAILSEVRPLRWLALRAPALYKDRDWTVPKFRLNKDELAAYRRAPVRVKDNRALRACAAFRGDALLVESEQDDIVPHTVIESYRAAFRNAHSLTARVIKGADHGLAEGNSQHAYTSLLVNWATEMIVGARRGAPSTAGDDGDKAPAPTTASPYASSDAAIAATRAAAGSATDGAD